MKKRSKQVNTISSVMRVHDEYLRALRGAAAEFGTSTPAGKQFEGMAQRSTDDITSLVEIILKAIQRGGPLK